MTIERFQPPQHVRFVATTLALHGGAPHYVGGAVRDAVIGREPHDYDIASSLTPDAVQGIFSNVILTGARHGTVTVIVNDAAPVEVTTFRADGLYADGRHPDAVSFVSSIEHDLRRRDFTMNAIAVHATTGAIVDPHSGVVDALAGVIRTVGDPRQRFAEDGLRVMRAIRFASQLGFAIDTMTLAAIEPHLLAGVSAERMRDELLKTLRGGAPGAAIGVLHSTGVLSKVLGQRLADASSGVAYQLDGAPLELRLAIAVCSADPAYVNARSLTRDLKLDARDARLCASAAEALRAIANDRTELGVRRTLSAYGRDATLAAAYATGDAALVALAGHEQVITARTLPFNGDDIMTELGLSGAAVGTVIRAGLAAAIVDPRLLHDRRELLRIASRHSAA